MTISTQLSADEQELTIAIQGRFDFGAHQAFRDAYERVDGTPKRYQVDLQGTTFVKMTNAGMRESHAHDIEITKEAPNYSRR